MFVSTALVYPAVLAVLCVGAGLLIDRLGGGFLPGQLLAPVGGAGLVAASQLTTYAKTIAPTTPYVLAAVGLLGFAAGWHRLRGATRDGAAIAGGVCLPLVVYVLALAPVLLAGRPSFSSYGVLPDSAVHMIGADFLIHHGPDYAGLDPGNSYGQYLSAYFNTSYPSGSDTFYGGSALLLGLPLIWAFQPFCAFAIALAVGPAWVLLRRLDLGGRIAGVAAVSVALPAIVYGYVLVGSIKEILSLAMILTLGVLVADRRSWLGRSVTSGIPFGVVTAAGVSALGIGFGAWVAAAVVVLVAWLAGEIAAGRIGLVRSIWVTGVGAATTVVCALPTWIDLSGSLNVAQGIAATSNPGNLKVPLRAAQIVGPWLSDSYRHRPGRGVARDVTYALIVVVVAAGVWGLVVLVRRRSYAVVAWVGGMLAVWVVLTAYGTTWVDAKVLMITAPVITLLAWAGVAGLWRSGSGWRVIAGGLGVILVGAFAASDAIQYRGSDLAPTARYAELASVNARFAGLGPTLFTPFDEWSLYVLRGMDVGGPDFVYPPRQLVGCRPGARGQGQPRPGAAVGVRRLPADRHRPRPAGEPAAERLQPGLAGHVLRGLAADAGYADGARASPVRERRPRRMPADPADRRDREGRRREPRRGRACVAGDDRPQAPERSRAGILTRFTASGW